ncbi:hypothetical protein, partial [Nitrosomonas sp.]|uniref:hypothetical protein n=1 Tax=Nitrosomonas sp. TaxID=42353 RepID=UPI00261BD768
CLQCREIPHHLDLRNPSPHHPDLRNLSPRHREAAGRGDPVKLNNNPDFLHHRSGLLHTYGVRNDGVSGICKDEEIRGACNAGRYPIISICVTLHPIIPICAIFHPVIARSQAVATQ